ncbi:MAG: protein-tyrosine-phosphatase [Cytophagales bacterium]|jgi:arsenate reductase
MTTITSPLFDELLSYTKELEQNFDSIPEERKDKLRSLSEYLSGKWNSNQTPKAIIICTHNSRRSHLGQLWLAVGADHYGFPEIETFSGGTEATAFHPNAVNAVRRAGFKVEAEDPDASNPVYQISWKANMDAYKAFSTRFDEVPNPTKEFAAIMVCSEADQGCPFVPGTDFRMALPFDDPKAFDGTHLQDAKYDERCKQIGTEMLFVMSNVELK